MKPCGHAGHKPGCGVCAVAAKRADYARRWAVAPRPGTQPPPRPARVPLAVRGDCAHEGRVLSKCPFGDASRDVIWCELHKAGVKRSGVCRSCADHKPKSGTPRHPAVDPGADSAAELAVETVARFTEDTLWRGVPGKRFNPSLAALPGGGYLFAARNGWSGSEIYAGRLGDDFRPAGPPWRLDLWQPRRANYGREDPRLFWHGGRLHVAYIGVSGRRGPTHQLFARLTPDGTAVEDRFAPEARPRRPWEKNWQFFDYGGQLYAVYLAAPRHTVLKVDSNATGLAYGRPFPGRWEGGEMRGGAAPVLVGDEFYAFFHDRVRSPATGRLVYRTGLYTFSARPPFAPRRWAPGPLLSADRPPFATPHDNYCDVIFCGGAALAGGRWLLAHGVHDRWAEIHALDASAVESRLVPL